MKNEIKYFSMFSGVGGFELGLKRANSIRRNTEECGKDDGLQSSTDSSDGARGRSYPSDCKRASDLSVTSRNESGRDKEEGDARTESITMDPQQFACVGMSEFDKFSCQVLRYRFPDIKNYGDCTKINPEELPDFDMLCGGFPCQAFSVAGKRKGFKDTRGTLFFEVARILEIKRPEIVLLENVKGLLSHEKGRTYSVILQTLDELGYDIQWMVLNSKFFGVSQNRERIFIVGSLRGKRRPEILPFKRAVAENSYEQLSGEKAAKHVESSQRLENRRRYSNNKNEIRAVATPYRLSEKQNGRRIKEPQESSFTAQDIHGIADGLRIRRLTPRECERLQGFPDSWTKHGIDEKGDAVGLSDTQRYKQMGNAVTVNVIKAIGERLSSSVI